LGAFLLLFLLFHLLTLTSSSLPSFEEVFQASISKSFAETGKLIPGACKETWNAKEDVLNGPVLPLLGSFTFKLFGFGVLQFRIIGFVFGILLILSITLLLRFFISYQKWIIIVVILLFLDPVINHSFDYINADLISIFFLLISLLILIKAQKQEWNYQFLLSGLFAAISILTTPMSGIFLIIIFFVLLFQLEGEELKKALIQLSLWLFPIVILYGSWISWSGVGISELIHYYKNVWNTKIGISTAQWSISYYDYILIGLSVIALINGIVRRNMAYFNFITIVSLLSIFLYHVLFYLAPSNSILVIPFYYILLLEGLYHGEFTIKNLGAYPLLILLIFNLILFSISSIQIISKKDFYDPDKAEAFVRKNIPKGSKVIGDATYYYAVNTSGSDFQLFDHFLNDEQREQMLREVYDYDYLILSARSIQSEPKICQLFLRSAKFQRVDEMNLTAVSSPKKLYNVPGLQTDKFGYNAVIFVRIKEEYNPLAYSKMD
jgi:4-amino-4-deoxy-L-arabinose transferase-like glycosyltransferase